ncbi:uncharacterized protein [Aegilops tauschii subsp. strangulata]|uniref:uncharacterized protein n=1 Tax=Aegilops tauschii subsp. strangulata TaxID=200361 RepID=UPI003CC8D66F
MVDQFLVAFLGGHRLCSFAQRSATGTRGCILMLWDDNAVGVSNIVTSEFCLSADIKIHANGISFKLTSVYGPTSSSRKNDFFAELIALKPPPSTKWLALGDFNQICRARDKNKRNVNSSRINRFRTALNSCELREIHMQNRRFTWSNERQNPTLCKLHALSSLLSDHCPLLLADDCGPRRPRIFRFENFWTSIPGFQEVVKRALQIDVGHCDPYQALLDVAQESRLLSAAEQDLRARLKGRVISLLVLERSRKKQCARISSLKEGDANTKFFHLRVNARRRKNHIL